MEDYHIVSTGSQDGNCLTAANGQIMIDVGVPAAKLINPAEGIDHLSNLKLVFLTHRHGDHVEQPALRSINTKRPSVMFVLPDYLQAELDERKTTKTFPIKQANIFTAKPGVVYKLGNFIFACTLLDHGDTRNVAWRIYEVRDEDTRHLQDKSTKIVYLTDAGNYPAGFTARNYDYYFLEANHNADDIEGQIVQEIADKGWSHRERAQDTHISVQKTRDFIRENTEEGHVFTFVPLHPSENFVGELKGMFPNTRFVRQTA